MCVKTLAVGLDDYNRAPSSDFSEEKLTSGIICYLLEAAAVMRVCIVLLSYCTSTTKQTISYPVINLLSIFFFDCADFEFLRPVDEQTPKDGADHGRGGGCSDAQQRALGRSAPRNGQ